MKSLKKQAPVKKLFLLVFTLMIAYRILIRIPYFPEELYGFGFSKLLKICIGIIFCIGSLIIYKQQKKAKHGTRR